ncbi:MAG: carboxylesterase [Paenibacillus sp.]|nr:carboxylesterase [Paenibacillus sp.]
MSRIYKTTEPFYFEGFGERASSHLLMIHGFTGSPSEFRRAGYYLNDLGYTVEAVLLPGHGTTPEDMIKTGWTDWWGHVLQRYDEIRDRPGKQVFVIGHSMGGLLALKLSMERKVEGIVSLATPIFLMSRKTVFAVLLQYFMKYIERKPTVAEHIIEEACTYQKTPIPCVVDLRKLLKAVKSGLGLVEAPIFIGQGEQDGLVHPKSAGFIHQRVASNVNELLYYPQTSHAMLLDEEREKVYGDIHRFIAKVQQNSLIKQDLVQTDETTVFS